MLTRNSLQPSDLKFVLIVGGGNYSPYVRKRIEQLMGIPVNTNFDPTNAVVVGAAYFAGTKEPVTDQKELKAHDAELARALCLQPEFAGDTRTL